jgi:acetyl esterase/lipase
MSTDVLERPEARSKPAFDFGVRDLVYQRHGGKERLARLYQPAGAGPFPAIVAVHGGAWNNKDRTDGQHAALELCAAGIVVLSIDFRNAPEAPYPASLQDINYGVRWLKAHAREFGSTPDRVGAYGWSSGGHQVLLSAIRPYDARYRALPLADAPDMDAKLAFAISGWGVLYPLERYKLAKEKGKAEIAKSHEIFWGTDEAAQIEATPGLVLDRGEDVYLPPALVFQGTKDDWVPNEQAERLAASYRKAGGTMELAWYDGEPHTFVTEKPLAANSLKAIKDVIAFIKKYGSGK